MPNAVDSHAERMRWVATALSELDTLVTPDTLMRWYRTLVAQKWTYTHGRGPGRPRTIEVIVQLIIRMALENRSWGYTRIQGALANLGHDVGRGTIANVLSEHGIDPAPERGKHTSWSTFLKAHWDTPPPILRPAAIYNIGVNTSRLTRSEIVVNSLHSLA